MEKQGKTLEVFDCGKIYKSIAETVVRVKIDGEVEKIVESVETARVQELLQLKRGDASGDVTEHSRSGDTIDGGDRVSTYWRGQYRR